MKKKVVAACMTVALAAVAMGGATLAYFTDTDNETNEFTVGDVSIDLIEEFEDGSSLAPGTKTQNNINKDAWIENDGSNDAWVRMKVYIPSALDQLTTPQYTDQGYLVAAAYNTVHWNVKPGVEAIWNVNKASVDAKAITTGTYAGYNEYIFYYNNILPAGETTEQLLDQVYLDKSVDCVVGEDADGNPTYAWTSHGEALDYQLENGVDIIVIAEAIQADGFATYQAAFAAFDAQ